MRYPLKFADVSVAPNFKWLQRVISAWPEPDGLIKELFYLT